LEEIKMVDPIDRQAAIDALAKAMPSLITPDGCGEFDHDIYVTDEAYVDCMQIIHELPSAQPYALDEWCDTCKEYDSERHCCPRWNRVIRTALNEVEPMRKRGKWIDKSGGIEDAWNYCSVCGEQAIDLYDFCPNCGADMREVTT
jgi:hypothetical protein